MRSSQILKKIGQVRSGKRSFKTGLTRKMMILVEKHIQIYRANVKRFNVTLAFTLKQIDMLYLDKKKILQKQLQSQL